MSNCKSSICEKNCGMGGVMLRPDVKNDKIIRNLKLYNPGLCDLEDKEIWSMFLPVWRMVSVKLGWEGDSNTGMLHGCRTISKTFDTTCYEMELPFKHTNVSCIKKATLEVYKCCELKTYEIINPNKYHRRGRNKWILNLSCFDLKELVCEDNYCCAPEPECEEPEAGCESCYCPCEEDMSTNFFSGCAEVTVNLTYQAGYKEIPMDFYPVLGQLMDYSACHISCLSGNCGGGCGKRNCGKATRLASNSYMTYESVDGDNMSWTTPNNILVNAMDSFVKDGFFAQLYRFSNMEDLDIFTITGACDY